MKYKEKHLRHLQHAVKALALATTLVLLPSGCTDKQEKLSGKQPQGLLNPTPIRTNDKYDASVTLYLVSIPVYERNGDRKQDQYMLTRGLEKSNYQAASSERYTRKAFINGSNDFVYVQTDENNAVYTERGFAGLFVDDDNKVVVVADENVSDFIKERSERRYQARVAVAGNSERTSKTALPAEKADSTLTVATDSITVDTIKMPTDSIPNAKANKDSEPLDTLNIIRQETRE